MANEVKKNPLLDDESSENNDAAKTTTPSQTTPAAQEVKAGEEPKPVSTPKTPSKTEAENKDIVAQTKAILAKQPKVNFIIPLAEGENPGAYDTVQINGYRLTIQKGVMVELPQAVANLLAEKYRINMTAGSEKRIDSRPDKTDALS